MGEAMFGTLGGPLKHGSRDPITGSCLDCGMWREGIDDNLPCDPVFGPHKMAIIALRGTLRNLDRQIEMAQTEMEIGESQIVLFHRKIQDMRAARDQVAASLDKLKD